MDAHPAPTSTPSPSPAPTKFTALHISLTATASLTRVITLTAPRFRPSVAFSLAHQVAAPSTRTTPSSLRTTKASGRAFPTPAPFGCQMPEHAPQRRQPFNLISPCGPLLLPVHPTAIPAVSAYKASTSTFRLPPPRTTSSPATTRHFLLKTLWTRHTSLIRALNSRQTRLATPFTLCSLVATFFP